MPWSINSIYMYSVQGTSIQKGGLPRSVLQFYDTKDNKAIDKLFTDTYTTISNLIYSHMRVRSLQS